MRLEVNSDRLMKFMSDFGREVAQEGQVFIVGGGSAILIGWRETTIDVDLKIIPETDSIFHAIQRIKKKFN